MSEKNDVFTVKAQYLLEAKINQNITQRMSYTVSFTFLFLVTV